MPPAARLVRSAQCERFIRPGYSTFDTFEEENRRRSDTEDIDTYWGRRSHAVAEESCA